MWLFTKLKSVKETLSGPLVLAGLKCCCGDNGHKMQTFFKRLVSKNAATW